MAKYNVFLSPEVRVKICNIDAASKLDAITAAEEWFAGSNVPSTLHDAVRVQPREAPAENVPYVEHIELSEDLSATLVDVVGDEEYNESEWFTNEGGGPWRPLNEQRVLVLTAAAEVGREEWDQVIGVFKDEAAMLKQAAKVFEAERVKINSEGNWLYGLYDSDESGGQWLKLAYITHSLIQ